MPAHLEAIFARTYVVRLSQIRLALTSETIVIFKMPLPSRPGFFRVRRQFLTTKPDSAQTSCEQNLILSDVLKKIASVFQLFKQQCEQEMATHQDNLFETAQKEG